GRTWAARGYATAPARAARASHEAAAHTGDPLAHAGGRLPEKMLAQHRLLALVAGAGLLAVKQVWLLRHALEREPADGLAMLDHEGHVARSHLERGPAAVGAVAPRRVAETGGKEHRVVPA